ncbi:hypothetical protein K9N50_01400 [bacterium]|nr:hypothetical protein [bacterium]
MKQSIIVVLLLLTAMIEVADAQWLYQTGTDPFDDSVTHVIYTVTFDEVPGSLYVRRKGSMLEIFILTLSTYIGTNNCDLVPAEWRFDKRESKSLWWFPSTCKKGAFLYNEDYKLIFLQNMKECNTLIIRFTKHDGGTVTMRFSLAGFTAMYNKYIGESVKTSPPSE